VLGVLLSAAAILSRTYIMTTVLPYINDSISLHNQIINNTAPAPYNYRVLVPYLAEGVIRLMGASNAFGAFIGVYVVFYSFGILFIMVTLFFFLKQWFTGEQSAVGALFVASVMSITLGDHFFQPWSFLEPVLLTLALLAIYHKRHFWLGVLVVIASLNRETGLMIGVAFVAASLDLRGLLKDRQVPLTRRELVLAAAYLGLWLAVYGGLRWLRGPAESVETPAEIWQENLTGWALGKTAVNVTLFMGLVWVFAARGLKHAPVFLRRVALLVPVYGVILIPFARWFEVRLLIPLYPILVGLALSFIYRPTEEPVISGAVPGSQ
jgi:hypothetical protein